MYDRLGPSIYRDVGALMPKGKPNPPLDLSILIDAFDALRRVVADVDSDDYACGISLSTYLQIKSILRRNDRGAR